MYTLQTSKKSSHEDSHYCWLKSSKVDDTEKKNVEILRNIGHVLDDLLDGQYKFYKPYESILNFSL